MLNPTAVFLSIALSTSASVIPLPAFIHLIDPVLASGNVSLTADPPDPRFSIDARFGTPPLSIDSCLVNVLYFMSQIAYGDFTQRHPPKTYRVPSYDEVEILTGTAMTARFLIWGVWLAIEYMMNHNRFNDVLWTLRWEETILGTIKIQASTARLSLPGSSDIQRYSIESLGTSTAEPGATISDPTVANNSLDARFAVAINSFADGKALTKYEIFMVCYTGLLHCAQKPTAVPMQAFGNRSPIGGVSLHVYPYGPSLAYAYIIRTLSHIPLFLLQDPRGFREVNFDLQLDEVLCAKGAITKGRV